MFRTAEQIENEVFDIGEKYLGEIGGYVLEVNLKGARGTRKIEIIADTEKGITLDELTAISKKVEQELDETNLFSEKYTLEITSPGLDRPLKTPRDFRRRLDRKVRIEHTMLEPGEPIVGTIIEVADDNVTVKTEEKGELVIPYDQIIKAQLELDW
ncbi:MAG: Ribosome maturation factor RimP [Candidatus Marinimicrobia bacterium]|nr:Ribosome maturation factor RimP [Candidatus Neomarinimicrobiota bacterium]